MVVVSCAAALPASVAAEEAKSAAGRELLSAPALDALVAEAVERSAELEALRQRIDATEASVRPAGALPDPTASLGVTNVPVGDLALDKTPMSGVDP